MDKKKLKVLDLDELEDQESNPLVKDNETIVDARVDIESLSSKPPVIGSNIAKVSKKVDAQLVNSKFSVEELKKKERFKNYDGDGSKSSIVGFLSDKHRFDKKDYVVSHILIFLAAVSLIAFIKIFPDQTASIKNWMSLIKGANVFAFVLTIYEKTYPIFIFVILYVFPLKRNTMYLVEIYFDGITIPSTLFAVGRPKRVRVRWRDIAYIEFKSKLNVPFVQVYNKKNELLGEIRLDFNNMKKFYEVLNTYCPDENPLRKLFTNL